MTWIEPVPPAKDPAVAAALKAAMAGYPPEYTDPGVRADIARVVGQDSIVDAFTPLPKVLEHAFSAYREAISPDLELTRREHELIATVVSRLNDCFY
ncbi:MAG: hypothetical protein M9894_17940 [Planctomycetes bacterium]|nr:hypothetical protein [Planctomycetota bacterium]